MNSFNIGYSDNGLFGMYAVSEGKNMDPVRDWCLYVIVFVCVCVCVSLRRGVPSGAEDNGEGVQECCSGLV